MHTLLFVDDDRSLLQINETYFRQRGYQIYAAEDQTSALSLARKHHIDCVVLDILLPNGQSGYEICSQLKEISGAPIVFLTSLTEQEFLYQGFASGGDDYLTKPYDLRELLLRIEARIRQSSGRVSRGEQLRFPPLVIDLDGRRVFIHEKPVSLTGNEFDILALLAGTPEQVFSADEIYRGVWKLPDLDSTHTVQVHVARMRRKLELAYPKHKFIQTAWGKGYLFIPV